jgi:microcystin-dependent protein
MSYTVTFTESNNPDKQPIVVQDGTIDSTTSLQFVGKNYTGYGSVIANDFLHLLENFANNTAPANPVQGQLWFDTSANINLLYVYDGTTWNPVGSLKKAGTAPSSALAGDLWVDTTNNQLYLYSGSSFVLIGPQFSSGLQTGPIVETIVDTNNIAHNVTTIYGSSSSDTTTSYRLAIISKDAFTPKANINGFTSINEGFNLSSIDSNNSSSLTRYWGTAQQADALLVGTTTVAAANFLRGDTTTVANYPINVRNDGGITLGAGLGFNIGVNGNNTVLYSKSSGNAIEFATNNAGTVVTSMHLNANSRLGIGESNTNPQSTLDVIGGTTIKDDPSTQSIAWTSNTAVTLNTYITSNNYYYQVTVAGTTGTTSPNFTSGTAVDGTATLQFIGAVPSAPVPGRLIITGTTDVTTTSGSPFDPGGASIQTQGGLSAALSASIGTTLTVGGTTTGTSGAINVGADLNSVSILPNANGVYDIGSSSHTFRNVYANTFTGNFNGTFTGSLTGSISGAAAKLQSATTFQITGDVTSPGYEFNGQVASGTISFNTTINQTLITSKSAATDSSLIDQFLVYQSGSGLVKMSKAVLFNHVATVPIGAIFPFAGTGSNIPAGYLLCDGSEVLISSYPGLFAVLQYTYKASSQLQGLSTFALPDLRGRFPLGPDNMGNGLTVPASDGSGVQISAGGGTANRVSSVTADLVGASSGTQNVTLATTNLPDHKHSLNDGNAQYYAVGSPAAASDANATVGQGLTVQDQIGQGYGLSNSGSIIGATNPPTPISIMNPYLTINYIIFTGVI